MKGDPKAIQAQFDTWKVRTPNPLVSEIPGKYTVTIRPFYQAKRFRLEAVIQPGGQKFTETFPESKLQDAINFVEAQFKGRVSQWEELFEVEGPDGYLLKKAEIITRNQKTIEDLQRRDDMPQAPAGGKAK